MRIGVSGKGANPWDVGIASAIKKPVEAGDKFVLAFWARLANGQNGAATTVVPFNTVQLATAPYTPLFNKPVTVGSEWKLLKVTGKADQDYPADALNASIYLATTMPTIDIGPVFVLNLGR